MDYDTAREAVDVLMAHTGNVATNPTQENKERRDRSREEVIGLILGAALSPAPGGEGATEPPEPVAWGVEIGSDLEDRLLVDGVRTSRLDAERLASRYGAHYFARVVPLYAAAPASPAPEGARVGLREVLLALEWRGNAAHDRCPVCNGLKPSPHAPAGAETRGGRVGHYESCALHAALAAPAQGVPDEDMVEKAAHHVYGAYRSGLLGTEAPADAPTWPHADERVRQYARQIGRAILALAAPAQGVGTEHPCDHCGEVGRAKRSDGRDGWYYYRCDPPCRPAPTGPGTGEEASEQ